MLLRSVTITILAVLFFVVTPWYADAADPPILHLKFDDGSGTTPQDSSSSNLDGSFTATQPTWSATVPDVAFSNPYSLDFTGAGDAVSVTWPAELDFGATDPRSFSFWYRPTANGEGQYSRLISWSNDRLEIAGTEAGATTHKITYFDGDWHATDITLTLNTWYHVTFTYDGTTAKFYIGDELQDEHALAGRSLSGTLRIGNRVQQLDEGINGQMDDIRIYDYALDATQVGNLSAGSDNPDSAPDETAPVISSFATSSITSSGTTITWTTDEVASTKVVYSVDSNYASTTSETDTSTRVTSHSKSLTGLLSCTVYNYKAVSRDAAGNSATSTSSTFTTTGCAGGATPTASNSTGITVSGAATTTLSASSRSIQVVSPANFTDVSSVVLQIKGLAASTVLDSIGKPTSSLSSGASIVFDVKALIDNVTEVDSFDIPVTVTYTYTDADVEGLTESSLSMYHYAGSTWTELDDCSVNTTANTITCEAPHFSVFAIFGTASPSSSSSSSGRSSGRVTYGCKDPNALNYEYFAASKPEVCIYTTVFAHVRDLETLMTGEDVMALQQFLNTQGYVLAEDGPGSPGNETFMFGALTRGALARFQSANGISPAAGYFGTITRAKIKELGLPGTWW